MRFPDNLKPPYWSPLANQIIGSGRILYLAEWDLRGLARACLRKDQEAGLGNFHVAMATAQARGKRQDSQGLATNWPKKPAID